MKLAKKFCSLMFKMSSFLTVETIIVNETASQSWNVPSPIDLALEREGGVVIKTCQEGRG